MKNKKNKNRLLICSTKNEKQKTKKQEHYYSVQNKTKKNKRTNTFSHMWHGLMVLLSKKIN